MATLPPQLVAISEGPNIILDKPILLIGRHQECDIQIPSRKISRRHCCLAQVDDQIVVRDLCSTNGIRINGVRVNEGTLKHGDELTIGQYRYQIQCFDGAVAQASAKPAVPGIPENSPKKGKDLFDSCDEPVALPEPGAFRASPPLGGFPPPSADAKRLPAAPRFPDNLKLGALSDSGMNSPK